ncbi:MAG TPA: hypothetical protein VI197_28715 [Polyangiaceae bacterium]
MNDPTRRRTLKDLLQAPEPMWLFQAADGRALGPVSEAMLLKGVLRGSLSQQALVHPVGQPQWRPIAAFPRLARAIERLQARVSGIHSTGTPADVESEAEPGLRSRVGGEQPLPRGRASGE